MAPPSRAALDPMERAKIAPAAPAASVEKSAESVAPPVPQGPSAEEQTLAPPAAVRGPAVQYRVRDEKRISLGGQMVVMRAGRVLTPEFAVVHRKALQEQGVVLDEVSA